MSLMFDVLFYQFKEGDPAGMPGSAGPSYGFVGATARGRAELEQFTCGIQVDDIYYVNGEEAVGLVLDNLSNDVTVFC